MAGENIRINDLPSESTPNVNDVVPVDGVTTRKTTLDKLVAAGRPLASQAEAEAGTEATKAMTALTVAQAIAAQGGAAFATAAQGALADSATQPGDLGAVATSNDYGDLDNLPTLGTAAATDASDYATAAQGGKADTAIQTLTGGISASVDATDPQNPIVNFTGTGTGDMLGANDLSDVSDVATARDNIVAQVKFAYTNKTSAEAFDPGSSAPSFLSLAGGDFPTGRLELFDILPPSTPEPTDLPAPAIVHLLDGTYYRWAGREFPLELGAKGDGTTDNSSFFEDLSNAMVDFTGVIIADRGVFKTDKTLTIPKLASFKGAGKNNTIITAAGSEGTFDNSAVLAKIGGEPTRIGDLSTDLLFGNINISFVSAQGLLPDDLLLLSNPTPYSYSAWRPTYCAGEFVRVLSAVDSLTSRLTRGIYSEGEWTGVTGTTRPGVGGTYTKGGYKKETLEVYKCDGFARGEISGASVIAPGDGPNAVVKALYALYARDLTIRDMAWSGSLHASGSVDHVYNACLEDFIAIQRGAGTFGTEYGLSIGESQHVRVQNFFAEANRHTITTGGNGVLPIVNRDISIRNGSAFSNNSLSAGAIDFHGNTEWSTIADSLLTGGGIGAAGNHNKWRNLDINVTSNYINYSGELTGLDHEFENITGTTQYNDVNRGMFDIGGSGAAFSDRTARGGTLVFDNVNIQAPNHVGSGILIRNRGFTAEPWSVSAHGIEYSTASSSPGTGTGAIAIFTVSGNPPSDLAVSDIRPIGPNIDPITIGGSDVSVPMKGLRASGAISGNTTTSINYFDVSVVFPFKFPKIPAVSLSLGADTTGGDRLGAYALSVSTTGFTYRVRRVDDAASANFTGAQVVKGSWTATLDG